MVFLRNQIIFRLPAQLRQIILLDLIKSNQFLSAAQQKQFLFSSFILFDCQHTILSSGDVTIFTLTLNLQLNFLPRKQICVEYIEL